MFSTNPKMTVLKIHLFCFLQMLSVWTSLKFFFLVKTKLDLFILEVLQMTVKNSQNDNV